jgi:hypothetical protein
MKNHISQYQGDLGAQRWCQFQGTDSAAAKVMTSGILFDDVLPGPCVHPGHQTLTQEQG